MAKAMKTSKGKRILVRKMRRDAPDGRIVERAPNAPVPKAGVKKVSPKVAEKVTAADKRLMQAAKEMLAHHRGELKLETRKVHVPEEIDVAAIRKGLGFSQSEFADHFGFALSAIKEWEQGRRAPERATRILLAVIATDPKAVEQALHRFV